MCLIWARGPVAGVLQAAVSGGLRPLGRFGVVDDPTCPTHLVRIDLPDVRSWFSTSVRPAWGIRSRAARRLGGLPGAGRLGFAGQALLLAGTDAGPAWPLAPDQQDNLPAIVGLGGGSTLGRAVLTYADRQGRPLRHVKVDPAGRCDGCRREAAALRLLAGSDSLAGSVPRPLGSASGNGWEALAQSHLPGPTLSRRWERGRGRGWERDTDQLFGWLVRLAEASAQPVRLGADFGSEPEPASEFAVPRHLPSELVASARRGTRLAALATRLVHGDLWPGNVVLSSSGVGVFDWELAAPGNPLGDALTYLVTAARQLAGPGTTMAEAGAMALSGTSTRVELWLRRVLASVGMGGLSPTDLDDLVMAELATAASRPAPGGVRDHARAQEWISSQLAAWQRWADAGRSPWGGTAALGRRDPAGPG